MRRFRQALSFLAGFLFVFASCFSLWQSHTAQAQNESLTYPKIITALNSKLPNQSFRNKTELINWLIEQIEQRQVDKPLTKDREDDLRQAGATSRLIEVIRRNSPPLPTPTPILTPIPTPAPKPAATPNAAIEKVWLEQNASKDGELGMKIHAKFYVNNLKGTQLEVAAYFHKPSGEKLKDSNQRYTTGDGQVSISAKLVSNSVSDMNSDFVLFMPYKELDLPLGVHSLKLNIGIYANSLERFLTFSSYYDFQIDTSSLRNAKLNKIWLEDNQKRGGKNGVVIHATLTMDNLKEVPSHVVAFFHWRTGDRLLDKNNAVIKEQVNINPTYKNSYYEDIEIFIPYERLNLKQKITHNLSIVVAVHTDSEDSLAQESIDYNLCLGC